MSDSTYAVMVRAGANLPAEKWSDERVTAVVRYLPPKFQNDPAKAIAFLTLSQKYELDPFSGELFAIEDDRGQMKLIIPRDGLIKIAKRDPRVVGHSAAIVYEGDDFSWANIDGKIEVRHESGNVFDSERPPVGAYCVVYMHGEEPDQIVVRRMSDYAHLLNSKKFNWNRYPQDMILARVTSAAYRLKVTLAGIYTEADFELHEDPAVYAAHSTQGKTEQKLEAITEKLKAVTEVEARIVEAKTEMEPIELEVEAEFVEPEPTVELEVRGEVGADDDELFETEYEGEWEEAEIVEPEPEPEPVAECQVCGETFDSPQALGGHMRKHTAAAQKEKAPTKLERATEPEEDRDVVLRRLMAKYGELQWGIEAREKFQNETLPLPKFPGAWDRQKGRVSIQRCGTEELLELEAALP